jgi:excisionase family DNA binding protein
MSSSRANHQIKPEFFSLAGASAYVGGGLSIRSLRRLISQGRLPAFRPGGPGGKILVRRADLAALVEGARVSTIDLDALAAEAVADIKLGGQN